MRTQVIELLAGWAAVVVFVEQNLYPNGNAKATVGQHTRSNSSGNDAWLVRARAKAAIASSTYATAIGFDLDLDDLFVFLKSARGEGLPTARTTGFLRRKVAFFADNGQVGIISALGQLRAFLLA